MFPAKFMGKEERADMIRKYENNRWKAVMAGLSVTAMIGCVVCGSMAWLMDKSDDVVNTFTDSHVDIALSETGASGTTIKTKDFKMIPGYTRDKDPKVTVKAGSQPCYVFIKVEESDNLDAYIKYAIDEYDETKNQTGWKPLTGVDGVYYRVISTETAVNTDYNILGGGTYTFTNGTSETTDDITYPWSANQVLVLPTVTEKMMDDLTSQTYPELKFTAYAVQLYKNNTTQFNETEAWALAQQQDPAPEETPTT